MSEALALAPDAAKAVRSCVRCGFCTATCPTYVLLGNELDGPRGRIQLMKHMLASGASPSANVVEHIDRCLSCLACKTTCPSGVNYMHLVDEARAHIAEHYRRPLVDRAIRALLAAVLPRPGWFRAALMLARLGRPLVPLLGTRKPLLPLAAMLQLAPKRLPARTGRPLTSGSRGKVAMLRGCAEPVLAPEIQAATARLVERMGFALVDAPGERCCGALVHHMGRETDALAAARANIDAWDAIEGLSGILITTSGCGTVVKNYGHMLAGDPIYAGRAARLSAMTRDISEFVAEHGLRPTERDVTGLRVAYHAACSLQHGQAVRTAPRLLLEAAGFSVQDVPEGHLCCGSAGTYNILQPEIAARLRDRKLANIASIAPDVIVSGNIGCLVQLGGTTPTVHLAEMLDWATGGPRPGGLNP
ncbi:MAG: glycolate oxidase subunit GlcF [Novosphingobium sp.]|nr:glycolate oxidase subunit GlcF [Novosphingobium sp.]